MLQAKQPTQGWISKKNKNKQKNSTITNLPSGSPSPKIVIPTPPNHKVL
jgi:hypothetical protein